MDEPDTTLGAIVMVRRRKLAATQRLLGDTIAISEPDWRAPVALPGWTRAHVATHVARNADMLRRIVEEVMAGRPFPQPASSIDKQRELEAGARRSPLDLQIDLDTSAGRLNVTFDALTADQWAEVDTTTGLSLADLPVARLNEVVLHHIDLDCGFGFGDLDVATAQMLLEWNAHRLAPTRLGRTAVELISDTGHRVLAGDSERQPVKVSGTDATLLGWLTGRLDRRSVEGAEHLSLGLPV
ncbi:MAG TPA: maleylpyruvate isomerase family mycothiol-dependent enzyme [Propionibacteriaceae bacterium]|nr:maleylpyruvate isomerase family mycothiol-dependent enzyme [Propionibacteriaceae bacterium]